MRRALLPSALLVALACSEPPEEPTPASSEPAEPAAAAQAEPADPDPESACGRALACCHAFVDVIPNVVERSACAGPREVLGRPDADARCRAMAAGWREALEQHPGADPPEACR